MVEVKVSKKGWVVIPKEIREKHKIKPGDKVQIFDVASEIIIAKLLKDPIAVGYGLLKDGPSMTEELLKERAWELEQEERDLQPPRPRA